MTIDNPGGWPDATRPGVPTLPEVDGFHWLLKRNGAWPEAWLWQSDADGCGTEHSGAWAESDGDGQPNSMARWYGYLEPASTPAEIAARVAAAVAEEREACALVVETPLRNLTYGGCRNAYEMAAAALRARGTT